MKKYEVCKVAERKAIASLIITLIGEFFVILILNLMMDFTFLMNILAVAIAIVVVTTQVYDLINIKGLTKYGYIVEGEKESVQYYDEFSGLKTFRPKEYKSMKVYCKKNVPFLLEMEPNQGGKKETISITLVGLYANDRRSFMNDILGMNPKIQVELPKTNKK